MIKVMQDLHIRPEEPFFNVSLKTLDLVLSSLENGDTFIQTGDLFHTSRPYPSIYRIVLDLLKSHMERGIKIIILAGNHDYHYDKNSYSTEPLSILGEGIELISTPEVKNIEKKNFLFLPWMPHTLLKKEYTVKTLKEFYENYYFSTLYLENADYLIYHFEDETVFMGGVNNGIDLSFIEDRFKGIKRLGGHIHLQSDNYIGTPYQTRYDEIGQQGRIAVIGDEGFSYEELPIYLKYADIDYSRDLKYHEGISLILTVKNAPSIRLAYEKFSQKDVFIRKVELQINEERDVSGEVLEEKSLRKLMESFVNRNKVDKQTSSYLFELL